MGIMGSGHHADWLTPSLVLAAACPVWNTLRTNTLRHFCSLLFQMRVLKNTALPFVLSTANCVSGDGPSFGQRALVLKDVSPDLMGRVRTAHGAGEVVPGTDCGLSLFWGGEGSAFLP